MIDRTPDAFRIHVPEGAPIYAAHMSQEARSYARANGVPVVALYAHGWLNPAECLPDTDGLNPVRVLAAYRSTVMDGAQVHVGEVVYHPVNGWRPVGVMGWAWAVTAWQPLPVFDPTDLLDLTTTKEPHGA
jgi:hypothetical protein